MINCNKCRWHRKHTHYIMGTKFTMCYARAGAMVVFKYPSVCQLYKRKLTIKERIIDGFQFLIRK